MLDRVDERFRDADGRWVGTSGRARVIVYNTDELTEDEVPDSVFDLTDPKWKGKIGIAPTNASFQAFVTAMRLDVGDDAHAGSGSRTLKANDPKFYENNTPVVEAVASGEIEVGLVNHYYLYLVKEEQPDAPVENKFLPGDDPGALVSVAGAGVLDERGARRRGASASSSSCSPTSSSASTPRRPRRPSIPLVDGHPAAARACRRSTSSQRARTSTSPRSARSSSDARAAERDRLHVVTPGARARRRPPLAAPPARRRRPSRCCCCRSPTSSCAPAAAARGWRVLTRASTLELLWSTGLLVVGVVAAAVAIGVPLAWLVDAHRPPGPARLGGRRARCRS